MIEGSPRSSSGGSASISPGGLCGARARGPGDRIRLLLAGHSHTFSWTYPLVGLEGGAPLFLADDDAEFRQGDGVVQVVSGVGGHSVRDVVYDGPYVAASFTGVIDPAGETGFAFVSVSPFELIVQYVAAGRVIGEFSIVIPIPAFGGGLLAR